MSASPPMILMSDEEDACIWEHELVLVKAKHAKEERQWQWEEEVCQVEEAERAWREAQRDAEAEEAQRMVEVEEAWRKAKEEEEAWKEAKKNKKAEASVAWQKQLELLSQYKVAACIAWEEDAWRASEAGEEVMPSRIMGYGKGKAPEKRVCTNCLRKGIECKWDEGGHGKSERFFLFFFDFNSKCR